MVFAILSSLVILAGAADPAALPPEELLGAEFVLANVVPPLEPLGSPKNLPIAVSPFIEHVRDAVPGGPALGVTGLHFDESKRLVVATTEGVRLLGTDGQWIPGTAADAATPQSVPGTDVPVRAFAKQGERTWFGTDQGLYYAEKEKGPAIRHESYGLEGPLATRIRALGCGSKGTLWVGTALGLSARTQDGVWRHVRGKEGLPVEDITALAIDVQDRIWIGSTQGAVLYQPYESGRQWFYRAGKRYLPDDHVLAVACAPDGTPYFATPAGVSRIKLVTTTLLQKAQTIEELIGRRHRRLGMVSECVLDNAEQPTGYTIGDNDNDGLWTAYHVAAMSLCFAATQDEAAKKSATESMHALYMLQNASGIPGLVARTVVPFEEGKKMEAAWLAKATEPQKQAGFQWRPTSDGKMYWKSDTSSDEIDGHFLAFYTFWEHVAQYDPAERELCIRQVKALADHIVDHNYQLIDWNGKRTRWGFWNPEALNHDSNDYLENGLNSLQILSFLKVAHHITGDQKYRDHYRSLIVEHHYLNNVLLTKKVFPDENNHSDDQLGFVAWYPILQLEKDPAVRAALHAGVRRHYLVVEPEKPSFYIFAYATIDPNHADMEAGIENLRQIPTDRRNWAMTNSHRADVVFDARLDRFAKRQLTTVLPTDERDFSKWNSNPYLPDAGGDGRGEDDGSAYLLPYWMARYHGFIGE